MLAREHDVLPVAIVLDLPEKLCAERNAARPDRDFGPHVLRRQRGQLRRGLRGLGARGSAPCTCCAPPRRSTRPRSPGPGCTATCGTRPARSTSSATCTAAGPSSSSCWPSSATRSSATPAGRPVGARHPGGRRAVFLGDLVDRGPDTPGVLRLVMGMVAAGTALCVAGNHEAKLLKALRGKNVKRSHGLDASLEQLARRDRGVPRRGRAVHRRPDQPLRAGRRPPGGGARRPDRALPRPRLRPGPRVLPVRADHRRDRRVRPAGPLPVGDRVPGPRRRGVRPHPGAGRGVAEQHPVPGHRAACSVAV